MGQLLSNLWRKLRPKANNQTGRPLDHHHNHQSASLDDTEKKQPAAESHCINISKQHLLHPLLLNWGSYNYNNVGSSTPHTTAVDLSSREKEKENDGDQVLEKKVTTRVTYYGPSVTTATVVVRTLGPYTSAQKLLLVGEGDFSFSASLAVAFGTSNPNIIATSLNSQDFLIKHYSKFPANKEKLETRGNMVLHGVDATKMVKHPVLGKKVFDCIIFNFPHVGKFGNSDSELCLHQKLVTDILRNAKKMIKRDGKIHITSKSNGFFYKWNIPKLGSNQGLYLIQEVKFNRSKYPGYDTKYGFGGDGNFHCDPSKTYKFGLSNN